MSPSQPIHAPSLFDTWRLSDSCSDVAHPIVDRRNRRQANTYFTWGMHMLAIRVRARAGSRLPPAPTSARSYTYPLRRNTCGLCQYFPSCTRGPPWTGWFEAVTYTFDEPLRTLKIIEREMLQIIKVPTSCKFVEMF